MSVEQFIADTYEPGHKLKKGLGALDLVVFGVDVIIGADIFVLTGPVAASNSGPPCALSFVIAGFACALAGQAVGEVVETLRSIRAPSNSPNAAADIGCPRW